ncbi:MAG: PilZ domain-containing protein [Thermodesulfobacteriota bacterium]
MTRGIPKTVLLVDNVKERCLALCTIINRFGYNVFVADSEQSFSRAMNGHIPNVAILNVRMPLVQGKTFHELIRSSAAFGAVRIVMMSGKEDQKLLDESVKKGANASFAWPAQPSEIFGIIEKLTEAKPRQVPRLRILFKASMATQKEEWLAYATSLSENGVFIRTLKSFPKGTRIRLKLDVPAPQPIQLFGDVIYNVPQKEGSFMEPGIGVHFVGLDPKAKADLKTFIEGMLIATVDEESPF